MQQAGKENLAEGYRAKRRKVDALNTPPDASTGFGAAAEPRNGIGVSSSLIKLLALSLRALVRNVRSCPFKDGLKNCTTL